MRVPFNQMYTNQQNATNANYAGLSSAMDHQQYRVKQSGDDPLAQANIISLNAAISEATIFENSAKQIQSALQLNETYLASYNDRLLDAGETLTKVMNGDVAKEDYGTYAGELHEIEDDLAAILNSTDANGNYIFGGTVTDTPPFVTETFQIDIDGDGTNESVEMYVYKGNDEEVDAKVGNTSSLPTTIDGSTVVGNENGGTIFETLATATYYLDQDQPIPENQWDSISASIDGATESLVNVQTEVGINMQQAMSNTMLYGNVKQTYQIQLSNEQDADIVESIMEMQKYEQLISVTAQTTKIMSDMLSISFLD